MFTHTPQDNDNANANANASAVSRGPAHAAEGTQGS